MIKSTLGGTLFGQFEQGTEKGLIVGLHGWGRNSTQIQKALRAALGQKYSVFCIDLPGHGVSPEPASVMGAREMATQVLAACAEIGFERNLVFFGHSMGGRVALCAAAQSPERVKGILISGTPNLQKRLVSRQRLSIRFVKWLNRCGVLSNQFLDDYRDKHGSPDYRASKGVMRSCFVKMVNEDYESELSIISIPVSMIWGANDTAASIASAESAAQLLRLRGVPALVTKYANEGHDAVFAHEESIKESITWIMDNSNA